MTEKTQKTDIMTKKHPMTILKNQFSTQDVANKFKALETPKMTIQAMQDSITMACRDNPDILTFSPNEILAVFIKSFQWGVLPNTVHQYAYILPNKGYTNKKGQHVAPQLQLQLAYKGMMELLRRNKVEIKSGFICANDTFEYGEDGFETIFKLQRAVGDRGEKTHFYALAKAGDDLFAEVMDNKQIKKIASTAKTSTVWDAHWEEMARKTAIKRLVKHVGFTDRLDSKTLEVFREDTEQVYDGEYEQVETLDEKQIGDLKAIEIIKDVNVLETYKVKEYSEITQSQYKALMAVYHSQGSENNEESTS